MNKQKTKFQGLFEPQPSQPIGEQAAKSEGHKAENQPAPFTRVKTNLPIRQDYFKGIKKIAVDEDKLIYEILEEAMGEYLERRKESKPETTKK
jgi:hypothetical protein